MENNSQEQRCYCCGRTANDLIEFMKSILTDRKEDALERLESRTSQSEGITAEEVKVARECLGLAPGLLSLSTRDFQKQKEAISAQYKGVEIVERLLELPVIRRLGTRTIKSVCDSILLFEKQGDEARRRRAKERESIEAQYNLEYLKSIDWIKPINVRGRIDSRSESPNHERHDRSGLLTMVHESGSEHNDVKIDTSIDTSIEVPVCHFCHGLVVTISPVN